MEQRAIRDQSERFTANTNYSAVVEAKKIIIDQSLPAYHPELSAVEIDQMERLVLDLIIQNICSGYKD